MILHVLIHQSFSNKDLKLERLDLGVLTMNSAMFLLIYHDFIKRQITPDAANPEYTEYGLRYTGGGGGGMPPVSPQRYPVHKQTDSVMLANYRLKVISPLRSLSSPPSHFCAVPNSFCSRSALWNTPVSTRYSANAGLMLGQRRRRWANIKPALVQYLVLTIIGLHYFQFLCL